MVVQLYWVLKHEEEIYLWMTTRPAPESSLQQEFFSFWWAWALLVLTLFWEAPRVFIPAR